MITMCTELSLMNQAMKAALPMLRQRH